MMYLVNTKLAFLVAIVAMATCCYGYSLGPSLKACQEMFPKGHRTDAQSIASPFLFTLNATSYSPGDVIEIFLNSLGEWFLKGAFVQVRSVNCTHDKAVGTFSVQPDDVFLQTLDCFERNASAVGHYNSLHIYNRTFYWHAPSTATGHVYVRATIARNKTTFWTDVFSDYILDTSTSVGDTQNLERCAATFAPTSASTAAPTSATGAAMPSVAVLLFITAVAAMSSFFSPVTH